MTTNETQKTEESWRSSIPIGSGGQPSVLKHMGKTKEFKKNLKSRLIVTRAPRDLLQKIQRLKAFDSSKLTATGN